MMRACWKLHNSSFLVKKTKTKKAPNGAFLYSNIYYCIIPDGEAVMAPAANPPAPVSSVAVIE